MIDYVIKMNGTTPEGHPIDVANFKHANGVTERIYISLIQGLGYAPFFNNDKPTVTSRQNVADNGYKLDTDDFVKHDYVITDKSAAELLEIIDTLKAEQKAKVKSTFERVAVADVTDGNSVVWDGGFDAAIKLDAAKRLAETISATDVTFYDTSNVAHTVTIADATTVILTVAGAFQTAMGQKQTLMTQIDAATTVAEVDASEWVGEVPENV